MRRQREEVERAERSLHELAIEANLAEVPEEWRRPHAPPSEGHGSASAGKAPKAPRSEAEPSGPPRPARSEP
jgi:hypothetical protein